MNSIIRTAVGKSYRRFARAMAGLLAVSVLMTSSFVFAQSDTKLAGNTKTIRQGVFTGSGLPGIYAAIDQGYFESEGIKLELQSFGNGPAMIAALLGGSLDITHADILAWATALAGGRKIAFVTPGSQAETPDGDLKSNQRLVVTKASGIKNASDLVGKKVGVGASQLSKVTTQAWFEKQEVDPAKIVFEIVAQPQALPNLLKSGEVAAVVVSDPAIQQLDQEVGVVVLGWPSEVVPPKATYTGLFATSEFVEKNADLIRGYVRAYRRGAVYFNAASAAEKARILKLAGFDLQVLSAKYPNLVQEFRYNKASEQPTDIAATQGWVNTGVRFGGVPKAVDIAPFVYITARERVQ